MSGNFMHGKTIPQVSEHKTLFFNYFSPEFVISETKTTSLPLFHAAKLHSPREDTIRARSVKVNFEKNNFSSILQMQINM